ncbi:hypothetical protein B0H14DRAFT_3424957 [Mycena olivaceomarginata]|nr:hypothetical protein B0H14DRAFT_3424957 [Mycena olivaceomarginata]
MARTLTDEELKTLGKAIIERKKQLQNWFRNKRSKIGAANPVDQSAAAFKLESVIAALLDVQPQAKKRARQTIQVFQTRNREAIRARLTDEGYDQIPERDDEEDDWTDESDGSEAARLKATRAERMRLRTRVVTAMWKEVSAEERAAVAAQVDQENEELRHAELNAEQESTAPKTPAQLQDGIDVMDALFTKVHGAAHRASKICFGETTEGNDFEDSSIDFDKHIVEAFEGFLRQVFSASECRAQALESEAVPANDDLRPVTVIPPPAPEPAPEPPAPKKKAKSKSKSKKKASVPSTVAAPQVVAPTQPVALAQPLPTTVADSNDDSLEYGRDGLFSRSPSPPPPPPPANLWPAGMPPPLSLAAAAALALQERGPTAVAALAMQEREGAPVGPTMAIDPAWISTSLSNRNPVFFLKPFNVTGLPRLQILPRFHFPSALIHPQRRSFVHPDTRPARFCKVWPTTSPRRCPLSPPRGRPLSPPTPPPVVTPAPPPVVTPALPPVVTPAPPPVVTPVPPPLSCAAARRLHCTHRHRAPRFCGRRCACKAERPPAQGAHRPGRHHQRNQHSRGGSDGQGVVVYCHGVGDNRKAARAAAAQAKAAERKAAAEALAAQRAKGWMHSADGSVVLLRARKPARNPDGSARDCKGIRAPQLDETEKAMLARADSVRAENEILKGKKRKALAASAAPTVAKKRRTGA